MRSTTNVQRIEDPSLQPGQERPPAACPSKSLHHSLDVDMRTTRLTIILANDIEDVDTQQIFKWMKKKGLRVIEVHQQARCQTVLVLESTTARGHGDSTVAPGCSDTPNTSTPPGPTANQSV